VLVVGVCAGMDLEEMKREIGALVVAKGFFLRLSSWVRRLMLGRKD